MTDNLHDLIQKMDDAAIYYDRDDAAGSLLWDELKAAILAENTAPTVDTSAGSGDKFFTVVFRGDLRKLHGNPLHFETAFGKVQAVCDGDALSSPPADTVEPDMAFFRFVRGDGYQLRIRKWDIKPFEGATEYRRTPDPEHHTAGFTATEIEQAASHCDRMASEYEARAADPGCENSAHYRRAAETQRQEAIQIRSASPQARSVGDAEQHADYLEAMADVIMTSGEAGKLEAKAVMTKAAQFIRAALATATGDGR